MRRVTASLAWRALLPAPVRWCAGHAPAPRAALLPENDDCDDFVIPDSAAPARSGSLAVEHSVPVVGVQREAEAPALSRLLVPLEDLGGAGTSSEAPPEADVEDYFFGAESEQGASSSAEQLHSLPYDDPKFAEALLEMEVQGQLDECWQDARRARIEDVKEIVAILKELKVRDIAVIDTKGKTSSFDYLVFGTCDGQRHIHIASWAVQDADKFTTPVKQPRRKTDDMWEAVPIGRIVVNLMLQDYREEVCAERKWAVTASMDPLDAARAPISEGRQVRVHGLWTLTLNLQDLEDFEVDYCKEALMSQV